MTDPVNPWEQRATAIANGFDPYSVTPASARRRAGDAGHGRSVVVPIYLSRSSTSGPQGGTGLLVRLGPGGALTLAPGAFPPDLGDQARFWLGVHEMSGEFHALRQRDGWVRARVQAARSSSGEPVSLVMRESDWGLLRSALDLRHGPAAPQDAPAEHVLRRYLGRLDGEDGTPSAGLWGRLALEAVSVRHPGRLADTRSLRWSASWGVGGFPAGSGGRAAGSADSLMVLDLKRQRVVVLGRPFHVRTLPDWEREQAAHDLGMPPRRLVAWPVEPLAAVLALFEDIAPAPDLDPDAAGHRPEPQDAPRPATPRDAT